ncbi:NUDIX domain-containing protein [Simiduia curdlanivorans]|uniref:NUDIX domain-containing protein n=1 Tax=Simiduia curdlanivorans TaxID=1492769 RepID=A0ABV8V2C2_9GAMM|nr:NUDIX domain-containing protein [Simiduia curdlanivorans]MDN3637889.1 NUDIX domain-containing protein [Simiduia curdlanivorans]
MPVKFTEDAFNGLIIDSDSIATDDIEFHASLSAILAYSAQQNKGITWLTLPIEKSHHVGSATALGFVFHCCQEHELTLVHKNQPAQFVPFIPSHTVGAGALIKNAAGEILVVQEYGMTGYKLPGGHVEQGERIEDAVLREVLEETGIECEFISVLGFTNKHPYRFGKSNLYFVCQLRPLHTNIQIQDTQEILDARWISLSEFQRDTRNSAYNHELFSALLDLPGLCQQTLVNNMGVHKKLEIFFANQKDG